MGLIISLCLVLLFPTNDNLVELVNQYCLDKKGEVYSEILYISIKDQRLYHLKHNKIINQYPISSAKRA